MHFYTIGINYFENILLSGVNMLRNRFMMDNFLVCRRWIGTGKDNRDETGLPPCSVVVFPQSLLPVIKPGFHNRLVPAELFYPKPAGLVMIINFFKLL